MYASFLKLSLKTGILVVPLQVPTLEKLNRNNKSKAKPETIIPGKQKKRLLLFQECLKKEISKKG